MSPFLRKHTAAALRLVAVYRGVFSSPLDEPIPQSALVAPQGRRRDLYWCTSPRAATSACAQIGVRAAIARRAGCSCAFRRRPRASRRARCVQRSEQNRRPRRCSPLDRARKRRPTRDPGAFFAPFLSDRLRPNCAHPFLYHLKFSSCRVPSPRYCLQVRCCPSPCSGYRQVAAAAAMEL